PRVQVERYGDRNVDGSSDRHDHDGRKKACPALRMVLMTGARPGLLVAGVDAQRREDCGLRRARDLPRLRAMVEVGVRNAVQAGEFFDGAGHGKEFSSSENPLRTFSGASPSASSTQE